MGMYVYSIVHAKHRENCFMFLKKDLFEISHQHNLVILIKIEAKLLDCFFFTKSVKTGNGNFRVLGHN